MQKQKIIRFVESLIILPLATMSSPFGAIHDRVDIVQIPEVVLSQKENIETNSLLAFNQAVETKELTTKARAAAIDQYFRERGMPLAGHGLGIVEASERYGLDYRLLAAISVRETTGGKFACNYTYKRTGDIRYTYNVFGWGSCKIKFESYEQAFDILAKNLSGNNPKTAHYYANKTIPELLKAYNPPSIVEHYAPQVMKIMDDIGEEDLGPALALNS